MEPDGGNDEKEAETAQITQEKSMRNKHVVGAFTDGVLLYVRVHLYLHLWVNVLHRKDGQRLTLVCVDILIHKNIARILLESIGGELAWNQSNPKLLGQPTSQALKHADIFNIKLVLP